LKVETEGQGETGAILDSPMEFHHLGPSLSDPELISEEVDTFDFQTEIESKWILNLSMRFRDNSDREKFFITYAKEPNKWLRVTVSLDYRNNQGDSLEADLKGLHYQRDKSAKVYQAIRDSLSDIQFYPTVTNLKIQTSDDRLHVHVTEDVNEIIKYPSVSVVDHIHCPRVKESDVEFDSHCSGFVYKIRTSLGSRNSSRSASNGSSQRPGKRLYVKKEIPGPDSVDEFLYEVNVLSKLKGSPHIINFEGLVVSDDGTLLKGLLIAYASGGTLVDLLYDHRQDLPYGGEERGTLLSLERRLKYARQIVYGLSTIHGHGFVQGDFTLSNVVLNVDDDAKLIDVNRRGCPVGWEPPELRPIIQSNMRVGMFIGVKSDVWQCGMVLWALGRGIDEPERDCSLGNWDDPDVQADVKDVPKWYKDIVTAALQEHPEDRKSAVELLAMFPNEVNDVDLTVPNTSERSDQKDPAQVKSEERQHIDANLAVSGEDIALGVVTETRTAVRRSQSRRSGLSTDEMTMADEIAPSTEYLFDSSGSYVVGQRGEEHLSDQRRGQSEAHRNARLVPEPTICHTGGKEVVESNDGAEEGAGVGKSTQRDEDSADDPRAKEFMRVSTVSTPVPASLLSERLRALAHVDSGFDEPKDSRKPSMAD
jgi:serine/threonine protein kinase